MAISDVEAAVTALAYKQRRHSVYWDYYDGRAPLVYSSEKLREIFSGLAARFTENWSAVVVDCVLDRMELITPVVTNNDALTETLADLWSVTRLAEDEYNLHEDIAVTGEAFVVAWPGKDGELEAFRNDSRLCHVEYSEANPRIIDFAAKWWTESERVKLTLYYPDRLEYYTTGGSASRTSAGETPTVKAFLPDDSAGEAVVDNPYGIVPVFHLRSNQRQPASQLTNVIEIQDAVNKLMADMMVAAEFGAFPQRYVISHLGITDLKNNPNAIWDLAAGADGVQPTQAGQFAAASLGNYLEAINKLSADIGIITRTPRHYFFAQGGDPSGEALIAMESPLSFKVKRLQASLLPTWRSLAAFLLRMANVTVSEHDITASYMPSATIQPRTQAEIRKINVDAGMPLVTTLRDEGWTEDDLAQMAADKAEEGEAQQTQLASAMVQAQRAFDQNAGGGIGASEPVAETEQYEWRGDRLQNLALR